MAGHPRTRASTRRPPSVGGSTTAVDAHVAAADPHTTYLKEADAASTYAPVSHTHTQSAITNLKRWYSITAGAASSSPADGATGYVANMPSTGFQTNSTAFVLYIPRAGTIVSAALYLRISGTAGTGEAVSVYIRHNNTTDYLVETLSTTDSHRDFNNDALSISVAQGDYVVFKVVCPTWATNPTNIYSSGTIIVEG